MYTLAEVQHAWDEAGITEDWFAFLENLGTSAGRASPEAQEEIKNWTEGYALLLKENGKLKHLLDRISETTEPYDENGGNRFTDEVMALWADVYPYARHNVQHEGAPIQPALPLDAHVGREED